MRFSRWPARPKDLARFGALALFATGLASARPALAAADASPSDLARVATVYRFAVDTAGYAPQATLDAIARSFQEYRHYTTLAKGDVPVLRDAHDDDKNIAQIDASIDAFEHHLGAEATTQGGSVDGSSVARWAIEAIVDDDVKPAAEYRARVAGLLGDPIASLGFAYGYDRASHAMLVRAIEPASPASRAGLLVGDRIVAVGTVALDDDADAAARALATDTVTLHLVRSGASLELSLTRTQVRFSTVEMTMPVSGIAYARMNGIGAGTSGDFANALTDPSLTGIRGIVIDLRHAVSGTLRETIDFVSGFVPAGTKLGIRIRDDRKEALVTRSAMPFALSNQIVLLVGQHTVGDTELFASALQRTHRAKLVGEYTAGGNQTTVRTQLDTGDGLELFNGIFVLPGNTADDDAETRALKPDLLVPRAKDERVEYRADPASDPQLAAAIASIR